jgi:CRP-like cAMP-binding protein
MPFWKKPHESTEWLSNVAFFDGFTTEELDRVVKLGDEVEVESGALLMDQGDPGLESFVIVDGEAGVYAGGEFIATAGPGSMVGEMALVDHRPRTASVFAETDMRLLRFDARHFRQLLDEMPKASERVMRMLHERMRPPSS